MLVCIAGFWMLRKFKAVPSFTDMFASKPVVIDETPILIKEIKSIAQLITVTYYDEVVADSIVAGPVAKTINTINKLLPIFPSAEKRFVLVAKGKVLAGTNLQLSNENIIINSDTLTVRLPQSVILDAIINPQDFEIFEERGVWNDEAVRAVKVKARKKMIDRALQQGILQKADAKAKLVIENFLLSTKYKKVNVYIQ